MCYLSPSTMIMQATGTSGFLFTKGHKGDRHKSEAADGHLYHLTEKSTRQ